jgi:2-methylcitrate dehydratase PrpD
VTLQAPPVVRLTTGLAEFIAGCPSDAIPDTARVHVPKALLDLAGVTVVGYTEPAGAVMRSYALSQAAPGPCALLGGGTRLTPTLAALANGTAGHAFDFDDIGVRAGHVSVAMMPAALAVAELVGASGSQFIDAMVMGYEIANRLTRMYDDLIDGPYAYGYHKPSIYAVFGGVAAVARLLGLDAGRVAHALGIAASQSGGLRVNFGTMTKPMHAGVANRTAIEATLLARDGFTASTAALEGRYGWFDVICRSAGAPERVLEGLGDTFAIEEGLWYKLYPSCGANHHAVEGTLRLMGEHHLALADVERIDVAVDPRNLDEVLVYPWPTSGLQGKFSLQYNVAGAIVDGGVTLRTFHDDSLDRLAVARERVHAHRDANVPRDGAVVTVHTHDGRTLRREQLTLPGTVGEPLDWDVLERKFRGNVEGILGDAACNAAIDAVHGLAALPSLSNVTAPLLGDGPA